MSSRRTLVNRHLFFLVLESVIVGAFLMLAFDRFGKGERIAALVAVTACLYLGFRIVQIVDRLQSLLLPPNPFEFHSAHLAGSASHPPPPDAPPPAAVQPAPTEPPPPPASPP
ncbi:MAG: hypothetical protein HZA54_15720 [Planctomycetes bacterium]|nr:hypothetical protein [Planctomycetota bacterium]